MQAWKVTANPFRFLSFFLHAKSNRCTYNAVAAGWKLGRCKVFVGNLLFDLWRGPLLKLVGNVHKIMMCLNFKHMLYSTSSSDQVRFE